VGRPGQRASQRGRADLAKIAIELLLVARKTSMQKYLALVPVQGVFSRREDGTEMILGACW
jgi:hypothetical protein